MKLRSAIRLLRPILWPVQILLSFFGRGLTNSGIRRFEPGEYTLAFPNAYISYSPWFMEPFRSRYEEVKNRSTASADRCYYVQEFASHCAELEGDFAECGVYRGGTARLLSEVIESRGCEKELHLFDSFEGIPESADKSMDGLEGGELSDTSEDEVRAYLKAYPWVRFHTGWIPETFDESVESKRFSFVHIDVDIYQSTYDCMEFFYPRLVKGGIILCDDYGLLAFKTAARAAIDEFLESRPERPIQLGTSQCVVIKL